MAMRSVRGGEPTTSGSDAGTLPPLRTIFVYSDDAVESALDIIPKEEHAEDLLLTVLERVSEGGPNVDPETFARDIADSLIINPLRAACTGTEVKELLEDIDKDGLRAYLKRWTKRFCDLAQHGVLDVEAAAIITEHLPPLVEGEVLRSECFKDLPSSAEVLNEGRWRRLSAKRDFKALPNSPFSKGWWERSLEHPQPEAAFQTPLSTTSRVSVHQSRAVIGASDRGRSSAESTYTQQNVVTQERRHLAAKEADKAAASFGGGPFRRVGDPRGYSGFWQQLEGKLLRRGWEYGGLEHFYLLTSLLPETFVNKAVGKAPPKTMSGFSEAVQTIHDALMAEYGGSVEVEKLLSRSLVRGNKETLTDFISRLDDWEDHCATAGAPVPDATLVQTYRKGVNHEASRQASYEYPCRWSEFRLRALTRAARVDAEADHGMKSEASARDRSYPKVVERGLDSPQPVRPMPNKGPATGDRLEVCRNHLQGRCFRADKCRFRHIDRDACRFWEERADCPRGEACPFKHAKETSTGSARPDAQGAGPTGGHPRERLHAVPEDSDDVPGEEEQEIQRIWAVPEHLGPESGGSRLNGPLFTLRFADGSSPLRALLDSGAVRNYISHDEARSRGWKVEPVATVARLANNSKVELKGRVTLPVSVGSFTAEVQFYILPRVEDGPLSPSCILGVRSMCDLGISLQFSERAGERQVIVKQLAQGLKTAPAPSLPAGRVTAASANGDSSSREMDQQVQVLSETLTILASKDGGEEALYCVDPQESESLARGEEDVVEVGSEIPDEQRPLGSTWRSVRAAPDYSVRLRKLDDGEVRDCAGQTHAVEATWAVKQQTQPGQPSIEPKPVFDYSRGLYARLNPEQQAAFYAEILKFTSRGWWAAADDPTQAPQGGTLIPEAIAFPVVQGKKTRPCVDMRMANREFPPSSYSGRSCAVILAQLRVAIAQASAKAQQVKDRPRLALATLDAETAFYRVRLSGVTAQVRCLGRRYRVGRVLFGHRAGPAILEEALSGLLGAAMSDAAKGQKSNPSIPLYCWAYVDDITLLGEETDVRKLYASIVSVGSAWGFTFSPAKSHWICFGPDGTCEEFDDFQHLGVTFVCTPESDHHTIRLRCSSPRLSARTLARGDEMTKREAFRWAGSGYDALGLHPECSLAADLIRRVSGKWPTSSWDEKIAVSADDAQTINTACSVLLKRTGPCEHRIAFCGTTLNIETDASPHGMGFCLSLQTVSGEQVALAGKAKCWKAGQVAWHQNRQEAYCLALSFVFCDSLMPYCRGMVVRFRTDSRTALSWLKGGERMTSRSIERIAISRLCDAVADLKDVWSRQYDIRPVMEHLSAQQNTEADTLSRLAVEWKIPPGVVYDGRFINSQEPTPVKQPEDDEDAVQAQPLSPSEYDAVVSLLFAISEDRRLDIPPSLRATLGRPARQSLLALQRSSPKALALFDKIRGASEDDGSVTTPDGEFSRSEDGLLLRRVRSAAWSRGGCSRLCFFIPTDVADGVSYAKELLRSLHIDSGCLNARYVRWRFSRMFSVQGLRSLADEVCRSCDKCQFAHNRRFYSLSDGGRNLTHGARGCWEVVSADLAEMGPDRRNAFTSALFLIDHFSRFALVAPLRNSSSPAVVSALSSFVNIFGPMVLLRTDGGPCFRGRAFKEFLSDQSIEHKMLPPHAPFSNGLVERSISAIKFITRQLSSKRGWSTQIHRVIARLNTKPLEGIGLSPHDIFFARPRRLPAENAFEALDPQSEAPADADEALSRRSAGDWLDRMIIDALKSAEAIPALKRPRRRGPPEVGSEVLVFTPNPLGGGSYERQVYRVHGVRGGATLQLVPSSSPRATVAPGDIREVHYFNTRPYYRSSGGHVSAPL